jgi:[ribosomal protein S5]-alanine N-acetyltransferase
VPVIPLLTTPLSDGRVALRLAAERDIPDVLVAHDHDPRLYSDRGLEQPPTGAELGREMEAAAELRAAGTFETLTILDGSSDECRGQMYVYDIDWDHARAAVGVWLAPGARGRGLASRALRLAVRWLFGEWGLERIELTTLPGNEAMICAARACGFTEEGVLRSRVRERGRRLDIAILSLLPTDLPQAQ